MGIITVANHKGGSAKTTTAVNLAAALAEKKRRVLFVDLDPQSNASLSFGVVIDPSAKPPEYHIGDVLLHRCSLERALRRDVQPGIDLVPSSKELTQIEYKLQAATRREELLDAELTPAAQDYDDVIIDCPPALGVYTANAVCVADLVIAPYPLEPYVASGFDDLKAFVSGVRRRDPPPIYILRSMVRSSATLANARMLEHIASTHDRTFSVEIPFTDVVRKSAMAAESVLKLASSSTISQAFRQLAVEVRKEMR
jgi:chromosome partitioning protein